jgi:hypothetical protein
MLKCREICIDYLFAEGDVPLLVLSLVTSLAVAFRNTEVLKCIGVWMLVS